MVMWLAPPPYIKQRRYSMYVCTQWNNDSATVMGGGWTKPGRKLPKIKLAWHFTPKISLKSYHTTVCSPVRLTLLLLWGESGLVKQLGLVPRLVKELGLIPRLVKKLGLLPRPVKGHTLVPRLVLKQSFHLVYMYRLYSAVQQHCILDNWSHKKFCYWGLQREWMIGKRKLGFTLKKVSLKHVSPHTHPRIVIEFLFFSWVKSA